MRRMKKIIVLTAIVILCSCNAVSEQKTDQMQSSELNSDTHKENSSMDIEDSENELSTIEEDNMANDFDNDELLEIMNKMTNNSAQNKESSEDIENSQDWKKYYPKGNHEYMRSIGFLYHIEGEIKRIHHENDIYVLDVISNKSENWMFRVETLNGLDGLEVGQMATLYFAFIRRIEDVPYGQLIRLIIEDNIFDVQNSDGNYLYSSFEILKDYKGEQKPSSPPPPKKEPAIGMTAQEVRYSTWGSPKDINKTTTAYGVSEQWVYDGRRYIYLDDGVVTAIQE